MTMNCATEQLVEGLEAFPGLARSGYKPPVIRTEGFTRMLPPHPQGSKVTDDYVWEVMNQHVTKWGILRFEDHLWDSAKRPTGLQFKRIGGGGCVNFHIPKGSLHIAGRPEVRTELLWYFEHWTTEM